MSPEQTGWTTWSQLPGRLSVTVDDGGDVGRVGDDGSRRRAAETAWPDGGMTTIPSLTLETRSH